MRKRLVRWLLFAIALFVVGWGGRVVLDRGSITEALPRDTTPTARTRVVLPAITPEATETAAGWEVYQQNPSDTVPTIVHEVCPQSTQTQTDYRIQPGQRFLARVSTCQQYKGRAVLEVKLQTETGQTVRGYAVKFDSFEPQ